MSETITLKPNSAGGTSGSVTDAGNAYDNDINSYTKITRSKSGNATDTTTSYTVTCYQYYLMDFSEIPSGVNFIGATLYASGYLSRTASNIRTRTFSGSVGAFNGSSSIKTVSLPSNTTSTVSTTLTSAQTETWINSTSPRIRCYGSCTGTAMTAKTYHLKVDVFIYDLYAVIEYELSGITFKTRIDGTWVDSAVSAKINGEWIKPKEAFVKKDGVWQPIS